MDDGSYNNTSYYLHTQGFILKDIEKLQYVLNKNFGIQSNLHKDKNSYKLYILKVSKTKFENVIKDFILPSFYYKMDSNLFL